MCCKGCPRQASGFGFQGEPTGARRKLFNGSGLTAGAGLKRFVSGFTLTPMIAVQTRFVPALLAAWLVIQLTGCRKPSPTATVTPSAETPVSSTSAVSDPSTPLANLTAGTGTSLAPSLAGDPAKEAVKTQNRFNRNTLWLSKLGRNDPNLRTQVLMEIQRAGLSPAEMQELRTQAAMYGIKL